MSKVATAVVTGANSGIGHAFAKLLLHEGYDVHAADIKTDNLKTLGCKTIQLDVSSEDSIKQLQDELKGQTVDLLLNIAGIVSPDYPDGDRLETTSLDSLDKVFRVNTFGPLLLTQALLPNLSQSEDARIGIMSSRVGSIGDNGSGGSYAYRASKAALNAISKSMANDLRERGIVVVVMHPGYTNTGLLPGGTARHPETVEPDEAAEKLWRVLRSRGVEETGRFWHREGFELPW